MDRMVGARAACFFACLIALIAVGPLSAAQAAFPGSNGKIVFSRGGELFSVNPDGSATTQLITDPAPPRYSAPDVEPAWSPNGLRIAWSRDGGIYLRETDGRKGPYAVGPPACGINPCERHDPTWSPDFRRIAFSAVSPQSVPFGFRDTDIHVKGLEGVEANLTNDLGEREYDPAWSPDGQRIAFVGDKLFGDARGAKLYVMDDDGRNARAIVDRAVQPSWSPDGAKLAFAGVGGIWSVNADGSDLEQLAENAGNPAWSPDGTRIAFIRAGDIYVMDIAGGSELNITSTTQTESGPDWQPIRQHGVPASSAFSPRVSQSEDLKVDYEAFDGLGVGLQRVELWVRAPGASGFERALVDTSPQRIGSFTYEATAGDGRYGFFTVGVGASGAVEPQPAGPDNVTIVDTTAPTSTLSVPASTDNIELTIPFSASDGDGSGVSRVELWYTPPGSSTFRLAHERDTATGGFQLTLGYGDGSYAFYALARDEAGNIEEVPAEPDAVTVLRRPVTDPRNGRIAFTKDGDIWSVNPDGSDKRRLTDDPAGDGQPAWSPDGTKIAFVSTRDSDACSPTWTCDTDIYVMDADGANVRHLRTEPGRDSDPDWSPDGSQIAWSHGDWGESAEIWKMRADGSEQTRVTVHDPAAREQSDFQPSWSPNGQWIAFTHNATELQFLRAVRPDGTGLRGGCCDGKRQADWSPDGTSIAFGTWSEYNDLSIGLLDTETNQSIVLTDNFSDESGPSWSPDGARIAFSLLEYSGDTGRIAEIRTMNTWGRDVETVVEGAGEPAWGPVPNAPPDCSDVSATPGSLRPANGKLRLVALAGATDPDGDSVSLAIDGVTQDEPVGGAADAVLGPDPAQVRLRAERHSGGDGRVYRIAFTVNDARGAACSGTAKVGVPRHGGSAAVESAAAHNSLGG